MVIGVDRFRAHFAGHEHQYVLIGGAACELIMDEVGLDFRATKDLDIVLVVEALDSAFAARFWAFVEEGDYEIRQSSEGAKVLYRFQKPKAEGYPAMLELFSRAPEGLKLGDDAHLTPLAIDEAAASLSAILLDESYYEFLKSMVREAGGIPVLDEAAIIPFKARAWLDLTRQRAEGGQVDERNIRKHRNDVARLLQLLSQEARYALPPAVAEDMLAFVENAAIEDDFDPRQFKVNMTREGVAARLRAAYRL
ncbi:MAG: hypothetical protein B7Y89_16565 [Novosphingobium sp. 32-60-15]|jgi:hypothetical protein|uniref:Nucleotidyl transferase AbiEii/AbiGii toxin family protein n=1 Tax=Sphingobium cyanobacteriorum TaxID=3063954 RepID=A0ABT8ZSP5_9SPHN|nr:MULTISPECIES: hypothetical protein [Sphingomonadaceae]MDO7837113.1 hypothetical protein [Sphingobium sp. HBC34]OYX60339.1 MAG: hypothetical protein B7Y89_16565 [Novosphingobium sp. 32-60-15]